MSTHLFVAALAIGIIIVLWKLSGATLSVTLTKLPDKRLPRTVQPNQGC